MTLPLLPTRGLDDENHRTRHRELTNSILKFEHDDSRVRTRAEIAAGVIPVNYAYAPGPFYDTRRVGAVDDNSTDNTTAVQKSLNALGSTTTTGGGIVYNTKGSKFNLKNLTFPARSILLYYGGDDTSDSASYSTNELRWFIANANASGIQNEYHIEAAFHPGLNIGLRKNVTGQDAFLGGGQSRTNPGRISFFATDEAHDCFRLFYEIFASQTNFAYSCGLYGWRRTYTLNGITNTDFGGGAPAVNSVLTGLTSGAKGYVFSSDASKTIVIWMTGAFVAGETVNDGTNTSVHTISSATFAQTNSVPLGMGLLGNGWVIGTPNDITTYPLTVGGPIGIQASRSFSQYIPTTYADPFYEWVDSYENSPPNGFRAYYNCTPAAASRRLTLRKYNASTDIAHVGAVKAFVNFAHHATAPTPSASSFGITSIATNGTGDYTITFSQTFARADFVVAFSVEDANDYPIVFARTTTTLRVKVFTNGAPGTARNITTGLNVIVTGGDI